MSAALRMLLYLTLCGTALACVVAIVQSLVGRRLPSRFYYFAYLLVLARFALPVPGLVPTERAAAESAQTQTQTVDTGRHVAALPSGDRFTGPVMDTIPEPVTDAATMDTVEAKTVEETAAIEPETPVTSDPVAAATEPTAAKRAFSMPSWGWTAVWALGAGRGDRCAVVYPWLPGLYAPSAPDAAQANGDRRAGVCLDCGQTPSHARAQCRCGHADAVWRVPAGDRFAGRGV